LSECFVSTSGGFDRGLKNFLRFCVGETSDPIFAAIARHRAALAALATINQLAEPAAYAAADQEMFAAADVMATTVPQTVSGAKALLDVTIADAEADGVEARCLDSLKVLRQALDRLAALPV
jgi:hypothetical protein